MPCPKGRRLAVALCAALVLAGCESGPLADLTQPRASSAERVGVAPGSVVEQDEEAPDVFQASERGLWDGRPSLGGVWVAHPDVREPQRVVIRNTANGKSTIGALFRRDSQTSGPRILVSSDAAATLEILAGQPADLTVVALVRREVEVAPLPGTDADVATGTDVAEATDASDVAAATLAATGASAAADAALADPSVVAPDAPAPRRGLFGFLRRDPASAAADPAATDTAAAAIAPAAVDAVTLDPPAAATPDARAAAEVPAGAPARPFVQVAIFSVEANATQAADQLRAAGVATQIRQSQGSERTIWRVLAGPAATSADLDALLNSVKGLGFADAYFVRG
ncbi:MAG: SPOR domain-containing protein [Rhodobacteraceae bacterium]|nr:SPOR domain-containing protein [Paracoccaceae bacterium]